jgi:hypothetical protein
MRGLWLLDSCCRNATRCLARSSPPFCGPQYRNATKTKQARSGVRATSWHSMNRRKFSKNPLLTSPAQTAVAIPSQELFGEFFEIGRIFGPLFGPFCNWVMRGSGRAAGKQGPRNASWQGVVSVLHARTYRRGMPHGAAVSPWLCVKQKSLGLNADAKIPQVRFPSPQLAFPKAQASFPSAKAELNLSPGLPTKIVASRFDETTSTKRLSCSTKKIPPT